MVMAGWYKRVPEIENLIHVLYTMSYYVLIDDRTLSVID
jgi:hypothetical protein